MVLHEWLYADVLAERRAFNQCDLYTVRNEGFQHRIGVATHRCNRDPWTLAEEARDPLGYVLRTVPQDLQ